ncbi:hypothetical protein [Caulobacter segnis]|uniref:hypothetical protein n=1 Tax=Caulobacter segnis TaxID=88688 RepID=UPI0026AAB2BB|nr:hypothetical protein [Caulobacter segnis]
MNATFVSACWGKVMADGNKVSNSSLVRPVANQSDSIVRTVSQAAFEIRGDTPFEKAIEEAVTWMRERNPVIPEEALLGGPFDVGGGGDAPAQAVDLQFQGGRIWAASLDVPDQAIVGRTWVTEITVGEANGRVHFGSRLINVTKRSDPPFMPTLPALNRRIVKKLSAHADSLKLTEVSLRVQTPSEVDELIALLDDPKRQLPVVVISDAGKSSQFAPPDAVANRLAGACHVFSISEEGGWELTKRFGKALSVFGGAARIYWPRFQSDISDPFDHPLWLTREGATLEARRDALVARVLSSAVHGRQQDYPRFNAVREVAAEQAIERMRLTGTSVELNKLFEEENARLTRELSALRSEFDQWLEDADETERRAEREVSELKWELGRARAQNESLRAALSSGIELKRDILSSADHFDEWSKANLSTNVWIAPKAIREFHKNCQFENLDLISSVLFLLDDVYVPMRVSGDSNLFSTYRSKLADLGCSDQPCFSNRGDIKRYPEYSVMYHSVRFWCEDHIKFGGGTDPRRMFRIYYSWNEVDGVLIIGSLPNHLDNKLTN